MKDSDVETFSAAWSQMSEVLSGKSISAGACVMVFKLLKDHDLEPVLNAMASHMLKNDWMPTPSKVIEAIEGPPLTNEDLIGLARSENITVLGSYVRQRITPHTLNTFDSFNLSALVKTLRGDIDRFISDYKAGTVSEHDQRLIEASGHSGCEPLRKQLGRREEPKRLESENGPIDPRVAAFMRDAFEPMDLNQ